MTTRIAHLASNNQLVGYMLRTQARLQDTQVQVSSEKVSQTYSGLARDSERLVKLENQTQLLYRYKENNEQMDLQLQTMTTIVEGIKDTIKDFREQLFTFSGGSLDAEERVADVQQAAFRALTDMQVHLNTDFNGKFLFSGASVGNQPIDLNLSNLANFQAAYDGDAVVYPITRAAHVETNLTTAAADTGAITFAGGDTITAATAGSLAGIAVGSTITVANSASNDGTYTVVSNDGTNITISGTIAGTAVTVTNTVAGEGPTAGVTLSSASPYSGDTLDTTFRVSEDRSFDIDINAIDPAFEKAIRAMALIAQGVFGTNGGLDNNQQRIDEALYLIDSALDPITTGTAPFGTELTSNIEDLDQEMGYERVLIDQTNTRFKELIGFFEGRIAEVENVDLLDAVTRLTDDQQALEASYQALARIKQLSLSNFL